MPSLLPSTQRPTQKFGPWSWCSALLSIALIGAVATDTRASDGPYARYRCTVLGDSRMCAPGKPLPPVRTEERIEPGSYARHLIYLGQNKEEAIANAAAAIGEYPTRRVVRITEVPLTGDDRHQQFLGNYSGAAAREETLSETIEKPLPMNGARTTKAAPDK